MRSWVVNLVAWGQEYDDRKKRKNDSIWINSSRLAEEWWPNLKEEILNGTKKSSIII
jgi:hypothetical protein